MPIMHGMSSLHILRAVVDQMRNNACSHSTATALLYENNKDGLQVFETEECFMVHHANAYDEGEEVVIISSGWGPAQARELLEGKDNASVPNIKLSALGSPEHTPRTSLWEHR